MPPATQAILLLPPGVLIHRERLLRGLEGRGWPRPGIWSPSQLGNCPWTMAHSETTH